MCETYALIGCGYDKLSKRENPATPVPATTTLTDISPNAATLLAKEQKANEILSSAIENLRHEDTAANYKVMEPSEIDFSQIENAQVVEHVAILEEPFLNSELGNRDYDRIDTSNNPQAQLSLDKRDLVAPENSSYKLEAKPLVVSYILFIFLVFIF